MKNLIFAGIVLVLLIAGIFMINAFQINPEETIKTNCNGNCSSGSYCSSSSCTAKTTGQCNCASSCNQGCSLENQCGSSNCQVAKTSTCGCKQ